MKQQEIDELLEEISSYLYGILIVLGISAVMLIVHLGFAFFFHS